MYRHLVRMFRPWAITLGCVHACNRRNRRFGLRKLANDLSATFFRSLLWPRSDSDQANIPFQASVGARNRTESPHTAPLPPPPRERTNTKQQQDQQHT